MAITVAVGVRNVCVSRRWKDEKAIFRSCIRTPVCFTHLMAQKPDQAPIYQVCQEPDQFLNLISKIRSEQTVCWNRLYE
jgi:hypothetical protein